jgi:hypothetical protein
MLEAMDGLSATALAYAAGLVVLAAGLAFLLRRRRLPGAAVMAGSIVGVLMGPTVLGRLAPDWFERVVIGAREERLALDEAASRQGANIAVGQYLKIPETTLAQLSEEREVELAAHQERYNTARARYAAPRRIALAIGAGLFLLLAGSRGPAVGRVPRRDPVTPFSIGCWAAGLPGGLAFVTLRTFGLGVPEAAAAAAAAAVGPAAIAASDVDAAERAEIGGGARIVAAGRIAMVIAAAAITAALVVAHGARGALWALPGWAGVLSWFFSRGFAAAASSIGQSVLLPGVTAASWIEVEIFHHFALWPIVLLVLIAGDGRWFGALVGAMLAGGRGALRSMRLVMGAMSAGGAQVAFASIAFASGAIAETPLFALLAGALYMELLTAARRRLAARIEEAEEELESGAGSDGDGD